MQNIVKVPLSRALSQRQALFRKAKFSTGPVRFTSVEPPTVPKPKKRHPIRNFFLGSTLLLTTGFAGAVYYSLQNDEFYYYFTSYVPFSSLVVDTVDDIIFRQTVTSHTAEKESALNRPGVKPRETVLVDGTQKANASSFATEPAAPVPPLASPPASPVQKVAQKVKDTAKDVNGKAMGVNDKSKEAKKKVGSDVISVTGAEKDNATVPASADSNVPVIALKSAEAKQVNGSIPSGAAPALMDSLEIDPLLADVTNAVNLCLRTHDVDLKSDSFYAGLVTAIERASTGIKQERADITARYQESLKSAQKYLAEENDKEYLAAKLNLVESYNNRLQNALDAVTKKAMAAANNKIEAQFIELQRQFNHDINSRVEQEREGRLGQLSELKKDIETLQEAMLSSGQILESEDGIVSFFVELANLQRALSFQQNVPLKPYLDSLVKALPSDPLVKAVTDAVPAIVKQYGVLSHNQLAARFQLIEQEIRKSSLVPPDAGVAGHLSSLAASHLLVRKEGFPEGDDVESVLARTNAYLQQGDITNAVAEVNSLQGWSKKVAADWLDEGRKRSELEFLVNVLSDEGRLWSISRNK